MAGIWFWGLSLYALMGIGLVGLFLDGREPRWGWCLIVGALWPVILALWGAWTLGGWVNKKFGDR